MMSKLIFTLCLTLLMTESMRQMTHKKKKRQRKKTDQRGCDEQRCKICMGEMRNALNILI